MIAVFLNRNKLIAVKIKKHESDKAIVPLIKHQLSNHDGTSDSFCIDSLWAFKTASLSSKEAFREAAYFFISSSNCGIICHCIAIILGMLNVCQTPRRPKHPITINMIPTTLTQPGLVIIVSSIIVLSQTQLLISG